VLSTFKLQNKSLLGLLKKKSPELVELDLKADLKLTNDKSKEEIQFLFDSN
jgi:hypothetical protein